MDSLVGVILICVISILAVRSCEPSDGKYNEQSFKACIDAGGVPIMDKFRNKALQICSFRPANEVK